MNGGAEAVELGSDSWCPRPASARRSYRSVRRARLQFGSRPAREPRSMIVDVGKRAA
jgi:hypothetical protein